MQTFRQLQAEISELQLRLEAMANAERDDAISNIQKLMADFDISFEDLGGKTSTPLQKSGRKGAKRAPKKAAVPAMGEVRYRDPNTGATWSGKGRQPGWIRGKDKEQFAVRH